MALPSARTGRTSDAPASKLRDQLFCWPGASPACPLEAKGSELRLSDVAIQAHGTAGVTDDLGLAMTYVTARTLHVVDGPDEIHRNQIGRLELRKYN